VVAAANRCRGACDPVACAAALYLVVLYCLQVKFQEWPEFDARVSLLLFSALALFAGPAALELLLGRPCMFPSWWPWVAGLSCAAVSVCAWRVMVRGPYPTVAPGSMKGRVSIVTGCNTGIGYETAQALAEADGTVIFACRSEDKARAAIARMMEDSRAAGKELSEDQLLFLPLDLASLESVRGFVDAVHRSKLEVHLLILNAGVMLGSRSVTKDGLEGTLAANHFGHFLLALLLLPTLQEAEARGQQPRIVMLGSTTCLLHGKFDFSEAVIVNGEAERKVALDKPYSLMEAYGQSKLANLLFVRELSRRMKELGSQIPVNCAHPGQVLTEVMRDMHPALVLLTKVFQIPGQALIKTPRQGSFCTLHVATAPELATAAAASGEFFVRLQPIQLPEAAYDEEAAKRLWELSEQATGCRFSEMACKVL
ncbi:unnamed protein product, partial [Polarella glacialis]